MGAGSSTTAAQPGSPQDAAEPGAAGAPEPAAEPESRTPTAEAAAPAAPEPPGDHAKSSAPASPKLLQKNGQISSINGMQEGQGEDPHEPQEEEAVVLNVGQREPENMIEKDDVDNTLVAAKSASSVQDDAQETVHEIIEPLTEDKIEELEQPIESQSNDVGFKKVFKFVGFKFTVKKDKNDKSDPVELLTVKKDDTVEANGADNYQDAVSVNETLPKETELTPLVATDEESQKESTDLEEGKNTEEEKQEKVGSKSYESESTSSFKKFFSWAGWRKKTSFKKSKEEEPETSEKKKDQDLGKGDIVEIFEGKKEDTAEPSIVSEHPLPQETVESIKDSRSSENEKVHTAPEEHGQEAQTSSEVKAAPLATEVFDEKVETVAEVHVSTLEEEKQTEYQSAEVKEVVGTVFLATVETHADLQKAEMTEKLIKAKELVCASGDDYVKLVEPGPEESALCQHHEGITNEVEMLSSQERGRLQGSPLKKLFTGTGLKKLSGKKHKGKRGDDEIKSEELGELTQVLVDSPETPEEQKGESSASSPEELTEVTEKTIGEVPQEVEIEEEGTVSDGERKREGVTPWASFKKMVTPKKRIRRLSESDKEDEVEKVKSATLSSTESAASDTQEEMKGHGDDQKIEEPKRRVDTSVSWEALICVGSSKKRARKSSSSDEEGGAKVISGDSQKAEDAGKKESGTEITQMHSHEGDQGPISSSPEPAGSPLEGEGVSTWVSFKRLVTPRKKSKSKMDERNEESGIEHSASDTEPVKEESWVSIKKLIPGRRKKRLDGKQEQVPVEEDQTEVNEDDSDIPAVVPLSEYDAAEQEKIEAQQAKDIEAAKTRMHEEKSGLVEGPGKEDSVEGLVHAVSVTVVEGERAVTSIEERSPSWISAKITEHVEEATEQPKQQTKEIFEKQAHVEIPTTKTLPDVVDTSSDTIVSELELTSEAVTAPEEATEITEASCAEETTEMVSAVSQLTDSPDTTEEATPVQEVEDDTPDLEALKQRTQEIIQAVIEKVKQSEGSEITEMVVSGDTLLTAQNLETKISEQVNVKKIEQSGDHQEINLEIGEAAGVDNSKVIHAEEQEQVQTAKIDNIPIVDGQQEVIEQTSSEACNKFNEVERSLEVKECKSHSDFITSKAETTGTETSQIPMEQISPVEISTDLGTFLVHFEDISIKQQKGNDIGDSVPALGSEVVETPVVTESSDKLAESPGFQSSQGTKEQSKSEELPVPVEEQIIEQMVQSLSGTKMVQDSGPSINQEMKDRITTKEQVSLDTELLDQTKIDQGKLKDENITKEDKLEYEKSSEKIELQNQIISCSPSLEEKVLVQEEALPSEILKVQSPETHETSLPLTVGARVEQAVVEAVSETNVETLDSVNIPVTTEKVPSESMSDQVVLMEKQSLTVSILQEKAKTMQLSAVTETITSSGSMKRPEEESQKLSDAACVEVASQVVKPTLTEVELARDGDILTIKTQSTTIVQNVIQTAIDKVSATDLNTQTLVLNDEEQAQIRKTEEVEDIIHVSERNENELMVQCEIKSVSTEDLAPAAVEQTAGTPAITGIYKDISVTENFERIEAIEVQIPELKSDEQHEEEAPQLEEKKEAIETKTEPKIDSAMSEEVFDEPKHVPIGETKNDIGIDHSDDPGLVPGEINDEDLCKESLDSNGPKLKETLQDLECQERLVVQVEKEIYSQSVEDTKIQTQEEVPKYDEFCEFPPKAASKES